MQDRPTFGVLSNQGLCHLCSVATTTENFSETKFTKKNQYFWFMGKHLSYNFHIWKNAYHRVFIQFSVRMELYDKKFLIYGNCMIRSFGQPGKFLTIWAETIGIELRDHGTNTRIIRIFPMIFAMAISSRKHFIKKNMIFCDTPCINYIYKTQRPV